MSFETIRLVRDARGIATLSLNRPEKRNALSAEMIADLTRAADELDGDAEVRAVVLAGSGSGFCAGGDLDWMRAQFGADRVTRKAEARKLAEMLRTLNSLGKPLIAAAHGAVLGGGVGLLAVSDVVIATPGCRVGLTETRLGLVPATIGPYVVARMGEGAARRVFFSGRVFDAQEAKELGLVTRVVEEPALGTALEAEVAPYLATAPGAVARTKALARRLGIRIDQAVIEETVELLADAWESPEAQAGITAFLEKREPPWRR
jgi:methylglutaconyl-CoA hydratase